jgi:hypothetical protein
MGRIKRGQMALTIIISLIIFACLIVAFERSAAFEVLNAMVVAVAVGVTVGFTIAAWHTLWADAHQLSAGDVLVLGIWLLWIGLIGAFFSLWMFRLTDDHWWLNAGWTAATRWFIFCGGASSRSGRGHRGPHPKEILRPRWRCCCVRRGVRVVSDFVRGGIAMTLISTGEKVVLALRGAPMLMTLLLINLTVLGMVTFLTVRSAEMRSAERGEMLAAC